MEADKQILKKSEQPKICLVENIQNQEDLIRRPNCKVVNTKKLTVKKLLD